MTVAVITTVAISLALFGGGLLINKQVTEMRNYWNERVSLTVYMCTEASPSKGCEESGAATDKQRSAIEDDLTSSDAVRSVDYVNQEEAWKDFKDRFSNEGALTSVTEKGDIPDNFRVELTDKGSYDQVRNLVQGRDGVDSVSDDQQVLEQFFKLLEGLKWAALLVAFVQLAAAALLIGNTIRLSAYSRRRETGIMRLVGASNFYIQLPFLLEGAISGLIGGVIASGFIVATKFFLLDKIQSWFSFDVMLDMGAVFYVIGVSVIVGVLLCTVASFLTLRRYLRV